MSTITTLSYLKKWLTLSLIYPCYNDKTKKFESTQLKFILLLLFVICWSVAKLVGYTLIEEEMSPFLFFGQFIVIIALADFALLNINKNTKKINKLFGYMDEITNNNISYLTKKEPTCNFIKFFCIAWNVVFITALTSMGFALTMYMSLQFVFQTTLEISAFYYMQAASVWRNLLCHYMKTQLLDLNDVLMQIDVSRGHCHDVHNLLDKLIIKHNLIVNWVDVFNDLFGRQTLLMKIYETGYILAALDMYLTGYFKNIIESNRGEISLLLTTLYVVVS